MYIDVDAVIKIAAFLGALGTIWAVLYKLMKWIEQQKKQDEQIAELRREHKEDIENIQKENCVMCWALLAALDGLIQQGANGEVTETHKKLKKHLNKAAHHWEEG